MDPRMAVLPYLQNWSGTQLSLRVLLLPRGPDGPLVPLMPHRPTEPPAPSFAMANFKFDVHLVGGLDGLPVLGSGSILSTVSFDSVRTASQLFTDLEAQFIEIGRPIDLRPLPA